jgi:hypothetical protein
MMAEASFDKCDFIELKVSVPKRTSAESLVDFYKRMRVAFQSQGERGEAAQFYYKERFQQLRGHAFPVIPRVPGLLGLAYSGSRGDAEVLAQAGFLRLSWGSRGDPLFYVLPEGIAYYEQMMAASPAVETVEEEIRRYLSDPEFKKVHAQALAKWEHAAGLLWAADSQRQLTTIGHLCREALQEFAASLAQQQKVDVSAIEGAKIVARLKAIFTARSAKLGTTESLFLDALVAYWGTVSDLVQRQEHGSQREGEPLAWEDGRRVVFQTCAVMYEVARALR